MLEHPRPTAWITIKSIAQSRVLREHYMNFRSMTLPALLIVNCSSYVTSRNSGTVPADLPELARKLLGLSAREVRGTR